jgi:thymidylate synthase
MIERPTALDAWKAALDIILKQGVDFVDSDSRVCKELLNLTVVIQHPDVASDEPIELVRKIDKWFYPSKEELINIIFNQYDLPFYEYTYGSRLFGYGKVLDQINGYVLPLLKKHPSSRRACAIIMDPATDMHITNSNTPSLMSVHFRLIDGFLHMTAVIRSNDFFIGWPANIYQLATLQRFLAQELSVKIGPLTTLSHSAHIFLDQIDDVQQVL